MLQPVAKVVETLYTVFWHKWPVHDLVLVILPPSLIKVVSNTRPYSKLGGTTLNGREEGGQYYNHRPVTRSDMKQERLFFRGSVSRFLQVVVASAFPKASCKNDFLCTLYWLTLSTDTLSTQYYPPISPQAYPRHLTRVLLWVACENSHFSLLLAAAWRCFARTNFCDSATKKSIITR